MDEKQNNFPLYMAIAQRNWKSALELLQKGVDIRTLDEQGFTALDCAIQKKAPLKLIEPLIQAGAKFSSSRGSEFLYYAVNESNRSTVPLEYFFKQYQRDSGVSYDRELLERAKDIFMPGRDRIKTEPINIDLTHLTPETNQLLWKITRETPLKGWYGGKEYIIKLTQPDGVIVEQGFILSHDIFRRGRKEVREGNRFEVIDPKELGKGDMGVVQGSVGTLAERENSLFEFKPKEERVVKTTGAAKVETLLTPGAKPTADESYRVVMPRLKGRPLLDILKDDQGGTEFLSHDQRYQIMIGLIKDLIENVTGRGIAHKDIKAGNTMVDIPDNRTQPIAVKIFDFGVSVKLTDTKGLNVLVGFYLPPEAALGVIRDGAAWDVYSVAKTIQRMWGLARDGSFDAVDDFAQSECGRAISQLFLRMSAVDPKKRMTAVDALQEMHRMHQEYKAWQLTPEGQRNDGILQSSKNSALDNQLFDAVKSGNAKKVEELVRFGANVFTRDSNKKSPLYFALESKREDIAETIRMKTDEVCLREIAQQFQDNPLVGREITLRYLDFKKANPNAESLTPASIREFAAALNNKMPYKEYMKKVNDSYERAAVVIFNVGRKFYQETVLGKEPGIFEKIGEKMRSFSENKEAAQGKSQEPQTGLRMGGRK